MVSFSESRSNKHHLVINSDSCPHPTKGLNDSWTDRIGVHRLESDAVNQLERSSLRRYTLSLNRYLDCLPISVYHGILFLACEET